MDTHRAQVGHVWQASVGLSLGLITVVGFAVDRRSWGLAVLALIPEIVIVLITESFRSSTSRVLASAAALERRGTQDSTVADTHREMLGLLQGRRSRVRVLAVGGITLHVVLAVVVAVWFDWSFAGGR